MSVERVAATPKRVVRIKEASGLSPLRFDTARPLPRLDRPVGCGGKALKGDALNVMAKVEQMATAGVQLVSEVERGHALTETAQNHQQTAGAVSFPLQGSAREPIEDLAALSTSIVNNGRPTAIVGRLIRW